jgi:hypothetical protein
MLHVTPAQGGALPDNRAYLDRCTSVRGGVKINCNAGTVTTNLQGTYGGLKVWYLPDGIVNIISMHELERSYSITYDSWDNYYMARTPKGEARFHKDEQGLTYIDLGESDAGAAMMLLCVCVTETPVGVGRLQY